MHPKAAKADTKVNRQKKYDVRSADQTRKYKREKTGKKTTDNGN